MLAVVIPKVAIHELRLHCSHELWIPTALDFDDERESFVYFLSRIARHCIDADIDALIRTDDDLTIGDDSPGPQVCLKMSFDVVREFIFINRSIRKRTSPAASCRCHRFR